MLRTDIVKKVYDLFGPLQTRITLTYSNMRVKVKIYKRDSIEVNIKEKKSRQVKRRQVRQCHWVSCLVMWPSAAPPLPSHHYYHTRAHNPVVAFVLWAMMMLRLLSYIIIPSHRESSAPLTLHSKDTTGHGSMRLWSYCESSKANKLACEKESLRPIEQGEI